MTISCTWLAHFTKRHLAFGVFGASAAALALAYVAEYGFGFKPCEMCYWQRIPFAVLMALALVAYFLPRFAGQLLGLCVVVFAVSAGLGVFHAGVEWRWWSGPGECAANIGPGMSMEAILNRIHGAPAVSCTDPALRILGLSMAGWNALYSAGCAVTLGLVLLCRTLLCRKRD
jgi:disulfide bond formation protein DsbB